MQHNPENDPLDQAPLLRSISREDPFIVPDGFFELFPQLVQERIQRQRPGLVQRMRSALVRPSIAWAAIVVVIGILSWLVVRSPGTPRTPMELAQDTGMDIAPEELFLTDGTHMDLLDELDPMIPPLSEVGTGLSEADLMAYLEQEELPLELLIEEL